MDDRQPDFYHVEGKDSKKNKEKRFTFKQIIAIVLVASLVGGGAIGAGYQVAGYILSPKVDQGVNNGDWSFENDSNATKQEANSSSEDITPMSQSGLTTQEIVNQVGPSVVSITSRVQTTDFFRNQILQEGAGSGVVFKVGDEGILILTNQHVVDSAQALTVTFDDNVRVDAQVVGADTDTDLAIIKIDSKDIPKELKGNVKAVEFGNSDDLTVGERAIAIGNPLGYNDTVTVGVISALDRELQMADKNMKLIQTDAAINPGNSGGALVNEQGQLVGINTAKISDTKVEGIGFAIPINQAKPIVEELVQQGYVSRPYLGIVAGDIDEEMSGVYKLPVGVYIYEVVKDSAADKAGLQVGDVIIEMDGDKILSMDQLTEIISSKEVGDKIAVTIVRNGEKNQELTITLQEKNMSNQ